MDANPEKPNQDIAALHPLMWDNVQGLMARLRKIHEDEPWFPLFKLFEGYRSPERQALMIKRGVSKSQPWHSAHQYGLAVDMVPIVFGKLSWSVPGDVWTRLATEVLPFNLRCPIGWDKPHCQHVVFDDIERAWR